MKWLSLASLQRVAYLSWLGPCCREVKSKIKKALTTLQLNLRVGVEMIHGLKISRGICFGSAVNKAFMKTIVWMGNI